MTRTILSSLAVAAMLSVAASNPVAAESVTITHEKIERSNAGAKKQFKSQPKQGQSQSQRPKLIDKASPLLQPGR